MSRRKGQKFAWKPKTRSKTQAGIVGKEFERIRLLEGSLTPANVVFHNKRKATPLHHEFEWNDKNAARSYRERQAAYLIRHLVIIREDDDGPEAVRAYFSIAEDGYEREYLNVDDIMSDPEARARLVEKALREARQWRRRYNDLRELAAVFDAIDGI